MRTYPCIEWISKRGRVLPPVLAAVVLVMALAYAYMPSGALALGAVVGAAAVFLIARVGIEVVEVIADTLLPR